jgi:hypothetical protein
MIIRQSASNMVENMLRGISITRLMACLLVLGLVGVQGTMAIDAVDRAVASWTFMVYLDGDNNLESCGIEDFMEMASVGSSAQINIVVQFDRGTNSDSDGGSSDYGNWASTKRFHVAQGDTPTAAHQVSDIGEANMGAAPTLQGFLEWGMNGYPASKYALVLWDHGGGWVYGVCSDDTDSGDSLLMPEVRQAISNAETSTGKMVNLVGFDACLMGMIEVAYDLRAYTDTVVFSEETEPGQGWAYDKVLASLVGNPTMGSQELGAVIVDAYSDYYGSSGKETLSAVATSGLALVSSALNTFAVEMSSAYAAHSGQISSVRAAVERFEYEMIVDLYDLALRAKNAGITTTLSNAADQLMSSIQAAVTRETHGELRSGAHGLSIYYPDIRSDLNLIGYRSDVLLAQDTSWDEFLELSFQGASSDQWEPDDSYTQASHLIVGEPQYHSILDGGADVDWAWFSLPSAMDVVIETSGVSGDTELFLYTQANVPSSYLTYDDDSGIGAFSRISMTLPSGTYYVMVREYGQNSEIESYQLTLTMPLQSDAYEPDGSPEQASHIAIGSSQLHSIGDGGADVDWVYFTLGTTKSVLIETSGERGDTRIWLYNEVDSQLYNLGSDDDTGVGLFSRLVMFDLAPGKYYVEVQEYYNDEEIPAYRLNVTEFAMDDAFEPDGDYLNSTNLIPGEEQSHSIGDTGLDADWFKFELYSDSGVYLETSGLEGDTVMSLYSADGVPDSALETDDDSGEGYFSLLEMRNLQQGHYYVEVEAYEGFYGFEPIPEYSIILFTDPSSPIDPTVQMSGTAVELGWSVPLSDGGSPIDHYDIQRSISGGVPSAFREVRGTSFIDENVSAGEGYVYSISAVTKFGIGKASSEVQIQIPIAMGTPGAIGALLADESDDTISLSWTQPDINGSAIIAYHVYRGTKSDGSDRVEIGQSTGPSYVDSTVEKEEKYYYWVAAENGNGMGAISVPISATAISVGGLGGILWPMILVVLAVIGVVVVLVLVLGRRSDARSRSGNRFLPTTQPGSQPQVAQSRCPSCGALIEGMQFCGNCGRRLP